MSYLGLANTGANFSTRDWWHFRNKSDLLLIKRPRFKDSDNWKLYSARTSKNLQTFIVTKQDKIVRVIGKAPLSPPFAVLRNVGKREYSYLNYSDVIVSAMASQITGVSIGLFD